MSTIGGAGSIPLPLPAGGDGEVDATAGGGAGGHDGVSGGRFGALVGRGGDGTGPMRRPGPGFGALGHMMPGRGHGPHVRGFSPAGDARPTPPSNDAAAAAIHTLAQGGPSRPALAPPIHAPGAAGTGAPALTQPTAAATVAATNLLAIADLSAPAAFIAPPPASSETGAAGVPLAAPALPPGTAGWSEGGPTLVSAAGMGEAALEAGLHAGASDAAHAHGSALPRGATALPGAPSGPTAGLPRGLPGLPTPPGGASGAGAPGSPLVPRAQDNAPSPAAAHDLPDGGGALFAPPSGDPETPGAGPAGWAAAPGAAPRAPGSSPAAAALLGALRGGLADDPVAAARALLAAGPAAAGEALAALALEGPIDRMLAAELLASLPPEAQSALIDHMEAALPPESRAEVLSAMGVEDDGTGAPDATEPSPGSPDTTTDGATDAPPAEGLEGASGEVEEEASAEGEEADATALGAGAAAGKGAGKGAVGAGEKAAKEAAAEAAAKGAPGREEAGAAGKGGVGGKGASGPGSEAERLAGARGASGAGAPVGAGAAGRAEGRALSGEALEVRQVLQQALHARMGGGGGDASGAALGAALGGLARLLKGGPEDACAVVDDVFAPKAAYVLHAHERRTGEDAGDGRNDEADELIDAMRSLDFAGLKAVALDRAATRVAGLRDALDAAAEDDRETLLDDLGRARTQAALLLASDPIGIARFARESPETFPRTAARNVMGELLRADEAAVEDALAAVMGLLLRPAGAGGGAHKAFAAGLWAGAGAKAAARIAEDEAIARGVTAAEAPGRLLARAVAAGRSLAAALGESPGGAADRDEALRTLDREMSAVASALGAAAMEESGADARRLVQTLKAALSEHMAALDPDVEQDLEGELLAGFKAAGA